MVAHRRREIGIRIALGAHPRQILYGGLRSGGVLIVLGAGAGVVMTAAVSRTLRALLYGIEPLDMTSYVAATTLLLAVGLAACLIPGRSTTSIDPTEAIRRQ